MREAMRPIAGAASSHWVYYLQSMLGTRLPLTFVINLRRKMLSMTGGGAFFGYDAGRSFAKPSGTRYQETEFLGGLIVK